MNKIFPINEYPQARYDKTREAFRELIRQHWFSQEHEQLPMPKLIIETFAGLGGQTRIMGEMFAGNSVVHRGWEMDPTCYLELAKAAEECEGQYGASEVDCEAFPVEYFDTAMPQEHLHPTLLVVDGAYSLAQHADYAKYHDPRADYLIICEQARTRLHLHRKTYGLSEEAKGLELYEEYLEKVADRHGRPLLGFVPTPYSPCYVLLGPVSE